MAATPREFENLGPTAMMQRLLAMFDNANAKPMPVRIKDQGRPDEPKAKPAPKKKEQPRDRRGNREAGAKAHREDLRTGKRTPGKVTDPVSKSDSKPIVPGSGSVDYPKPHDPEPREGYQAKKKIPPLFQGNVIHLHTQKPEPNSTPGRTQFEDDRQDWARNHPDNQGPKPPVYKPPASDHVHKIDINQDHPVNGRIKVSITRTPHDKVPGKKIPAPHMIPPLGTPRPPVI